jgi:hypothetical protein
MPPRGNTTYRDINLTMFDIHAWTTLATNYGKEPMMRFLKKYVDDLYNSEWKDMLERNTDRAQAVLEVQTKFWKEWEKARIYAHDAAEYGLKDGQLVRMFPGAEKGNRMKLKIDKLQKELGTVVKKRKRAAILDNDEKELKRQRIADAEAQILATKEAERIAYLKRKRTEEAVEEDGHEYKRQRFESAPLPEKVDITSHQWLNDADNVHLPHPSPYFRAPPSTSRGQPLRSAPVPPKVLEPVLPPRFSKPVPAIPTTYPQSPTPSVKLAVKKTPKFKNRERIPVYYAKRYLEVLVRNARAEYLRVDGEEDGGYATDVFDDEDSAVLLGFSSHPLNTSDAQLIIDDIAKCEASLVARYKGPGYMADGRGYFDGKARLVKHLVEVLPWEEDMKIEQEAKRLVEEVWKRDWSKT